MVISEFQPVAQLSMEMADSLLRHNLNLAEQRSNHNPCGDRWEWLAQRHHYDCRRQQRQARAVITRDRQGR